MATHIVNMEKLVCEKFDINAVQPYQKEVLLALLKGQDVFVSKKTGVGKSLCYQGYSTAVDVKCLVIVVSPLNSIMDEQCDFLNKCGIKSVILSKEEQKEISDDTTYIFTSPEVLLGDMKWRNFTRTSANKGDLKLFAVDEAHLVLSWGEVQQPTEHQEAFRPWYSKLGELRSLAPSVPLLALTATANKAHRSRIQKKLLMRKPFEIIDSPDRPNVKLSSIRYNANLELTEIFAWILHILKHEELIPRMLVFNKTIEDTSKLYNMCLMDGTVNMSKVEMFHSMTPENVKDRIRIDMCEEKGNIRVLFCTNAAGMGVNYKNVQYVINFGPPQDMDTFLQHIGRAGRTGNQAHHLLIYTGRQLRNLTPDMLQYVRNSTECRREMQLKYYKSKAEVGRIPHLCCDICDKHCNCGQLLCETLTHPAIAFAEEMNEEDADLVVDEQLPIHISDEQKDAVQISLEMYAETNSRGQDLLPQDLFGVDAHVIQTVTENVGYIASPDDLLIKYNVPSYVQAVEMFRIICDVLDSDAFATVEDTCNLPNDD